mgnify:CR=1 FL=1
MAIVGLLAIFGLQYVWLVNTYKLAKESIQFRSNEVFKDASMQELFHRTADLSPAHGNCNGLHTALDPEL